MSAPVRVSVCVCGVDMGVCLCGCDRVGVRVRVISDERV